MKKENQVNNLELGIKLKELGFKQDSYFIWVWNKQFSECCKLVKKGYVNKNWDWCSAYTVAELINLLGDKFGVLEQFKKGGFGAYVPNDCGHNGLGETPQDALANLLIETQTYEK